MNPTHGHVTRHRRLRDRLGRLSPARLLPPEARAHLWNAQREELLALRSLLDAAIARLQPPRKEPS